MQSSPCSYCCEIFVDGDACVSYGPLVLIVGGYSASGRDEILIFNTTIGEWTHDPNMLFSKGSFAWGVIRNQLYNLDDTSPTLFLNDYRKDVH